MTDTIETEDKPAKPVRQEDENGITIQAHVYTERERTVIHLHDECRRELLELRRQRDQLEDQIRDLVPVEYRLARMVGIIQRAYEDDDVGETD